MHPDGKVLNEVEDQKKNVTEAASQLTRYHPHPMKKLRTCIDQEVFDLSIKYEHHLMRPHEERSDSLLNRK
ncbi:hypothetical protein CHS0354_036804, partial [Potamilus streckersoni]